MDEFRIRILDQYWITKDTDNKTDLCSHGLIDLKINGITISDENDDDWTISTAGLMLLRTVEEDHHVDDIYPIIQHCGQLGMIGCPVSIDWTVIHQNNMVIIKDIKKHPTTDENDVIFYKDLEAAIDKKKYTREVVRFCDSIKEFFKGKTRNFQDNYEQQEWICFWQEFDKLLDKHRKSLRLL